MKTRQRKKQAFQTPTLLAGALLLLIIFVSAGYIVATHPTEDLASSPEREAFERAKRKWQRREPAAYSYAVDRDCYCSAEYRETYVVTVFDGATGFALKQDTGRRPPDPLSIGGIFELLDTALHDADTVSVTYDTDFGFPDNLRIDWRSGTADDEQAFYIRELRALP